MGKFVEVTPLTLTWGGWQVWAERGTACTPEEAEELQRGIDTGICEVKTREAEERRSHDA